MMPLTHNHAANKTADFLVINNVDFDHRDHRLAVDLAAIQCAGTTALNSTSIDHTLFIGTIARVMIPVGVIIFVTAWMATGRTLTISKGNQEHISSYSGEAHGLEHSSKPW